MRLKFCRGIRVKWPKQALAFRQDGLAKLQFIFLVVDRDVTNADIAGMVQIMQRLLKRLCWPLCASSS